MRTTWEEATSEAIRRSKAAAEERLLAIDDHGKRWTAELLALDNLIAPADGASLANLVAERVDRCLEGLRGRAKHLDTLHIVLFGRTGAGKSSFVEALSRGTGTRISPEGRLDFTTTIDEVAWGSVTVVDTPGVEGWAENDQRELIEAEAHDAVQRADVVVLMFDDYNQKTGEFEQISEWVASLGKVAIAVLNVRDDEWRYDARLWDPDDREPLVQQIRETAGHIERQLLAAGLPGVPIIAVNLAWAFGARASRIRRHPEANVLKAARKDTGADALEAISNFPAAVELLTELFSHDPVTVRLGGLDHEYRTSLTEIDVVLGREVVATALRADQSERAVCMILARTGAPVPADLEPIGDDADRATVAELVSLLEDAAYDEVRATRGGVAKLVDSHLQGPLTAARSRGAAAARETLQHRDGRFKSVVAADLQGAALTAARFADVCEKQTSDAITQLASDVVADAESLKAEFDIEVEEFTSGFDANAGKGRRVGGAFAGFGAVGGSIVAATFIVSNPLGWAIGIGAVGSLLAKKLRTSGHKKRAAERLRVERELAAWLKLVAGSYERESHSLVRNAAIILAGRAGLAEARSASAQRRTAGLIAEVRANAAAEHSAIGNAETAIELLSQATHAVEEWRFPDDVDAGPKIWLGEDWLDAPAEETNPIVKRLHRKRLGDAVAISALAADATAAFWLAASRAAAAEPLLASAVAGGGAVLDDPPVVAFAGDYSSGKTSLLRRLAVGWGITVDECAFAVGATPTTNAVASIEGGGLTLRDTPGLGSGDPEHDRLAVEAVAGAALIVTVSTPASGRLDRVADLLGAPGRDRRTLHVLGRIDQLSARPDVDSEGFIALLAIKREELAQKLKALGLAPHADVPLPVAADPGRRHGAGRIWAPADFLPFLGWDGIDDLAGVLLREAHHGRVAAAIDQCRSSLLLLMATLGHEGDGAALRLAEIERIARIYRRAANSHARAEKRAENALRVLVDDAIDERLESFAGMAAGQLQKVEADAGSWFETQALADGFAQWRADTLQSFKDVYDELGKGIEVRVGSRAFRAAFGEGKASSLGDDLTSVFVHAAKSAASHGAEALGKAAAERLPQVAAQLGQAVAKGVASAAGVVLEGAIQGHEARAERKRVEAMRAATQAIRTAANTWCDRTLEGTAEEPGMLDGVRAVAASAIKGPLHKAEAARDDAVRQRELLGTAMTAAATLIDRADLVLT